MKLIRIMFLILGVLALTLGHSTIHADSDGVASTGFNISKYQQSNEFELGNHQIDENWNEIDYIIVLHDEGSTYIKDANERNIPIINIENTNNIISTRDLTHFKSVSWVSRNGVMSLSSIPKSFWTTPKESSWRQLVLFFQYHPMYRHEGNPTKFNSMYNQYVCHIDYKAFVTVIKGEYVINIEPHKTDKGYWGFVSSGCN